MRKPTSRVRMVIAGALAAGLVTSPFAPVAFGNDDSNNVKPDVGTVTDDASDHDEATNAEIETIDQVRVLDTRADSRVGVSAGAKGLTADGALDPAGAGFSVDVLSALRKATGDAALKVPAVVVNITVVNPEADGFVTAWGAGKRPNASTVNFAGGQVVANGATVPVDPQTGFINLYSLKKTHVIVDLLGFYEAPDNSAEKGFIAVTPTRVADSRENLGIHGMIPAGANAEVNVLAAFKDDDRIDDVEGVLLNVTAVGADKPGFLTVYPADAAKMPPTSNVNYGVGTPRANNVFVKIDEDTGKIKVFALTDTHVLVDVVGFLADSDGAPAGQRKQPSRGIKAGSPRRMLDSRSGSKHDNQVRKIKLAGVAGLPAKELTTVYVNLTVTDADSAGYATVGGNLPTPPKTSQLNYQKGDTVSNTVPVKVAPDGTIDVFTQGAAHVIVDVFGFDISAAAKKDGQWGKPKVTTPAPGSLPGAPDPYDETGHGSVLPIDDSAAKIGEKPKPFVAASPAGQPGAQQAKLGEKPPPFFAG